MTVNKKNKLNLGLCEDDYNTSQAEDGFIFESASVTDILELEEDAFLVIWKKCMKLGHAMSIIPGWDGKDVTRKILNPSQIHINIYFAKVTTAFIAVLNVCRREGISVTLYNYDTVDKLYYPVDILGCMSHTKSLSTHSQIVHLKTAIRSSIQIAMYKKHRVIISKH